MSTYNCRGSINGIIVQNNPVNFIDPDGENIVVWVVAGAVAVTVITYPIIKWLKSPTQKKTSDANDKLAEGTSLENDICNLDDFYDKREKSIQEMRAVLEVYNKLKPHELIKPGPRNPGKRN